MANGKIWDGQEISVLHRLGPVLTDPELNEHLNRSSGAIKSKRLEMGIFKKSRGYPQKTRERALALYAGGLSAYEICRELDNLVTRETINRWTREEGIARTKKEAAPRGEGHPFYGRKGPKHPRWKGDECGVVGQHHRARKDFPSVYGLCEVCRKETATVRMRIDHSLLPYHPNLVIFSCQSCNLLHTTGKLSLTFVNPHDGKEYGCGTAYVLEET